MNESRAEFLRRLPPVGDVLRHPNVDELVERFGRTVVLELVRTELEQLRSGEPREDARDVLLERVADAVVAAGRDRRRIRPQSVINATGVVLHTGLGRAPLSSRAADAVEACSAASNVELDLASGDRRHRGHQLQDDWRTLTGCEDVLLVNNNAAATLLVLAAHCAGREVVISRGQLVEIGGSFRLPEIFALGGAILREVGTTNRTRVADYEAAIGEKTAAILRVHPSNFRIDGFTEMPPIEDLVPIAKRAGLLCIDDIGSGCLVDTTRFGLPPEPTFQRSIAAGADLVLGSGDKLLGGPQGGIVLGTNTAVEPLRRHPFARTVRCDKTTLAAMSGTLESYLLGREFEEIPVLARLSADPGDLRARAERIRTHVAAKLHGSWSIAVRDDVATIGGGSLPMSELPTSVLGIGHAERTAAAIARGLRTGNPPVVPRIREGDVLLDLRSVSPEDDDRIVDALNELGSRP